MRLNLLSFIFTAASNYDISYTYDDTDVNGTESTIVPVKVSSGTWYKPTNALNITNGIAQGTGSINTGTNTLTWASLTSHSFDTGAGDEAAALPIHLLYFTAKPQSNRVRLDWATASETNNDYFTVERSQDGENFSELFKKPGAGISTTNLYYFGYDNKPFDGISYYRLKQTDYDGKYEYSNIESVNFNYLATNKESDFKIYPNPAVNHKFALSYEVNKSLQIEMKLYNAVGQLIYQTDWVSEKGVNQKEFSFPELAEGLYMIELYKANEEVQKYKVQF